MFVKSVTIENLKGFKDLHFDFERPDGSYPGWTIFVGGNASGKSSLLKGISLALMGPDAGRQLLGSTVGWIHNEERRAEAKLNLVWDNEHDTFKLGGNLPRGSFEASVRWVIENKETSIPLFRSVEKRNARGTRIQTPERGPWSANSAGWFSAGYGPMRRLSGSSSESIRYTVGGGVITRFVTLFREDAALSESESWLKTNHSRYLETQRQEIQELVQGVSALLSDNLLPNNMKISRVTVDHVFIIDANEVELPMRDISDGCRSIYATLLDLVHGMYEVYGIEGLFQYKDNGGVVVNRPGVVLIDEIESHLHPEWQRNIGFWLKNHFPNVQFLVTTHSPLICQAADENGIFVLPEPGIDQPPQPLSMEDYRKVIASRPDTILLTPAFGLKNTRSPIAVEARAELSKLKAKKRAGGKLTGEEEKKGKQLLLFETNEEDL